MKYLIKTSEIYRADSEEEAKSVIEEAKKTSNVIKYNSTYRCKKSKGEILDEWYKVEITKEWTDEKEPDNSVVVSYRTEGDWQGEDEE